MTFGARHELFCWMIARRNNYQVPKAGLNIVKRCIQIWRRYVTLKCCLVFFKYSEFIIFKCSLKLARVWHNYVHLSLLYYVTVRSLH